jgi:hypothetical protein
MIPSHAKVCDSVHRFPYRGQLSERIMNKKQYRYCEAPPASHGSVREERYEYDPTGFVFLFRKEIDRQSRSR